MACFPGFARAQSSELVQPTFNAGEIGQVIATFPVSVVGNEPTIADFQHGLLYIGSSSEGAGGDDSWYNIANPRSPVLVRSQAKEGDKPHGIGFWGPYYTKGTNGAAVRVQNFHTGQHVGQSVYSTYSIWDFVQAPFVFTGASGYTADAPLLEVWSVSNPSSINRLKSVDTGSTAGFKTGGVHAIGNLLIVSGSEGPGAAVYDISNPTNPQLLSATTAGGGLVYTSMVYGSRLYNCEQNSGVRVFDFSNPANITHVGLVATGGNPRYIILKDGKGHITPENNQYRIFNAASLNIETTRTLAHVHEFALPLGNMAFLGGAGGNPELIAIQQNPDTLGPKVEYANPPDGSLNIAVSSRIGFSMSDHIDVRSLNQSTFVVRPVGGAALAGTYSTQMGIINFTPSNPLQDDIAYEVILPQGGIKDVVGNGLQTAFQMTLSTGTVLGGGPPSAPTGLRMSIAGTGPPPAAPGSLIASAVSSGRIDLSWSDNSNNETRFKIERKIGAGQFSQIAFVGTNITEFSDTSLNGSTPYTYRVRASNSTGNSGFSNEASATTPEGSGGLAITDMSSSVNPLQSNAQTVFTIEAIEPGSSNVLEYSFNFGDGASTPFSTASSAAHSFAAPGRYAVIGRVRSGGITVSDVMIQIVHHPLTAGSPATSSTIIYDPARHKVWNVNPDNDTVTRIDAISRSKDFEIGVGVEPRAIALRPGGAEVWVACEDSAEIRILNAGTGSGNAVIPLHRGSKPMGIVFAPDGSAAYVALDGTGQLLKINPATRGIVDEIDLGISIRSIAVSADSSRLLVTRFISPWIDGSNDVGEVFEVAAAGLTLTRVFGLEFDTTSDSESNGRGVPNYLMDIVLSPDGRTAWIPSKKDNTARGKARDGLPLSFENSTRGIISQIDFAGNQELLEDRMDINDQGMPSAVAFSPVGDLAFVSFIFNNEILVFNAYDGASLSGLPVEKGPLGLCLSPDGGRLFVHNFLSRSVTTIDTSQIVAGTSSALLDLGDTSVVGNEKLSSSVLNGKRIFYNAADPRMSKDGYVSCASCHLDGGQDGRVWDFTDRGEGLRNTITLRGRSGMAHGLVHWSGNFDEIQDFEHDIRGQIVDGVRIGFGGTGFMTDAAFNTGTRNQTLGDPKAGVSQELDDLAAYVASLDETPDSPFRNANGTLTASAQNGLLHFQTLNCNACHGGDRFTDSIAATPFLRHDVGTIKPSSGQRLGGPLDGFDTPTLKGIWATAPYLHDGSAPDLAAVFNVANAPAGSPHADFRSLNATQRQQLIDFLLQIDESQGAAGDNGDIAADTSEN